VEIVQEQAREREWRSRAAVAGVAAAGFVPDEDCTPELRPGDRPGETAGKIVVEVLLAAERAAVVTGTADTGHAVYTPWQASGSDIEPCFATNEIYT
ncbi:hypothetical protein FQN49_007775, partial [Arthroderma sp. PD_2]